MQLTYSIQDASFTKIAAPPEVFGFGNLTFTDLSGANGSFPIQAGVPFDLKATTKFAITKSLDGSSSSRSPYFPLYINWEGTASELEIEVDNGGHPPVPEPATYALLGASLIWLGLRRRR
ncbi:MAG: PEP-CTERM sorting domain-containing protein [Acidobacteria bacterium]|nr:PEP-CTERM sorting domain-containing protein [Acidobacteriota bacterium]